MNNEKTFPSRAKMLKATKIEIFSSLSEKFGSAYGIPQNDATKDHTMNFQLDRLFTIMHDN
ncbi:hypothetical protein [Ekhidna sp.]|uniref:hypothetical protein n=1 Tax=Ekhidna sp. TaxID=2608089 RepID=UPI003B514AD8